MLHDGLVSDRPPALWRLAAAPVIDAAPGIALIIVGAARALGEAGVASGAAGEPDGGQGAPGTSPLDRSRTAELARRLRYGLLAYDWLEVALICTLGQTPGMALVGLKVVRSDGAPLGATGAVVRVFGYDHLVRALTKPLRDLGPRVQGGAWIALALSNAAAAVSDPRHRTLWNRLTGTSVVRA